MQEERESEKRKGEELDSEKKGKIAKLSTEEQLQQASAESIQYLLGVLTNLQEVTNFIVNTQISKEDQEKKLFQYAFMLNAAVAGECALKVINHFKTNQERIPKSSAAINWDFLKSIRNYFTHKALKTSGAECLKAIQADFSELITILNIVIKDISEGNYDNESQNVFAYSNTKEFIKKVKPIKDQEKNVKFNNEIKNIKRQISGVEIILDEIKNIREFINCKRENLPAYAIQMAMLNIRYAIQDRLGDKLQKDFKLKASIDKNNYITWGVLISAGITIVHENFTVDVQSTFKSAEGYLLIEDFFNTLLNNLKSRLNHAMDAYLSRPQALKKTEGRTKKEKKAVSEEKKHAIAPSEKREPFSFSFTQKKKQEIGLFAKKTSKDSDKITTPTVEKPDEKKSAENQNITGKFKK